jgi:hypothetical protein
MYIEYIYSYVYIYVSTQNYLGKKRGRPFTSRENTPRGEKGADKGAVEKGARLGIYTSISVMYLYYLFGLNVFII